MPDVLICDRDRTQAETWAHPIAASGHTIDFVESSSRAVQRVLAEPCGVVFVSVSLSDEEGLDTISVVHDLDSQLPVVAVAERESLDLEREARLRKVFYYLVQPVDAEELEAVVGRALAAKPGGGAA